MVAVAAIGQIVVAECSRGGGCNLLAIAEELVMAEESSIRDGIPGEQDIVILQGSLQVCSRIGNLHTGGKSF
ncbi:hypothetical protein DSECCO2_484130 [anaerobic digester metagenome]